MPSSACDNRSRRAPPSRPLISILPRRRRPARPTTPADANPRSRNTRRGFPRANDDGGKRSPRSHGGPERLRRVRTRRRTSGETRQTVWGSGAAPVTLRHAFPKQAIHVERQFLVRDPGRGLERRGDLPREHVDEQRLDSGDIVTFNGKRTDAMRLIRRGALLLGDNQSRGAEPNGFVDLRGDTERLILCKYDGEI